jgi:hypothetical protein
VDFDWGGCKLTRKSISGGVVQLLAGQTLRKRKREIIR